MTPASFAQEQLWFIDEFHHGLPANNVPFQIRMRGPLDAAALSRALRALTERHETLRTRLVAGDDGHPVQVIDPPGEFAFSDAGALAPFHLGDDHPLRGRLVRVADDEHVLELVAHQTAVDDASLRVFLTDLAALYAGESLAELPERFTDYVRRQREQLRGQTLDDLADYWRTTLAGAEISRFPSDRPRPVLADHSGEVAACTVDETVVRRLRELHDELPVTLLTALLVLLHRYTGQSDLVVGTVLGRDPGLDGVVGFAENLLPVRVDAGEDPSFRGFLARVHAAADGARKHADLPFARIVDALDIERDPGRFPVFQTAFRYAEPFRDAKGANLVFHGERLPLRASRYDIAFLAEPAGQGLRIEVSYTPALFDAATVERLLGHYQVLLRGVADDPGLPLSRLPVLTRAELHAELFDWNDTDTDLPVECIHEGIQRQAAATPAATAAEFESESLSYAGLDEQANQVARRLRELGAEPEVLVGVCMGTGLRRLVALLGVWKSGAGYVPLDPDLPPDRLAFMLKDTGMRLVLTDAASAGSVPEVPGVSIANIDEEWDSLRKLPGDDLSGTGVTPSNVAYVIYTSGSTGQPKGVVVEHGQAIHFLHGMARHWRIDETSAVLGFAAFTFDVSVMDMFMPLLGGAKIVLAAPETLHSPPRLAALIRDAHITFACLPPTVLNLLIGQDFPELRTLLSSGEELSSELLKAWLHIGADIYNGYGPTECSIGSVFMKLEPSTPLPPPIGRPKPNYRAYVLDRHLNPVPVGVTGELHIGGPGVTRGYLNRPDLTRQRFIADPFRPAPGARLYKTGDLVRRRPDGTLVFAGRIDNQVKIRGLRVELGEIESALASHPDVAQAVVTVVTDHTGAKQLAAYLVISPETSTGEIRSHVAHSLPAYMVPQYFVPLAELPLTAHGKINKAALPSPLASPLAAGLTEGRREPPRTLIETVLTDLYGKVLGTDGVGVTDSFFAIGGDSLQAMRLITQLCAELAIDLDITAVFLTPTPRQLAGVLRDKHGFIDSELSPDGIDRYLQDNPA
jgi:amino acid adenylation domain-containing protein